MPYLIKGPVPTRAVGSCPWCEKKNRVLHLMAARIDGQLGGEYVCAECILSLDKMTEERWKEEGRQILHNNPELEVNEDA